MSAGLREIGFRGFGPDFETHPAKGADLIVRKRAFEGFLALEPCSPE